MNKREDIAKAFDSQSTEPEMYKLWEESGLFTPEGFEEYLHKTGKTPNKPFVMTLPPPNANGDLHVGHTCGYSYHDLLGRYHRRKSQPVLLLPGKDHASIQTEAVYVRELEKNGESKWKLGREEFFKRCYKFCMDNSSNARGQEKRIGLSADWKREFFTLDERLTKVIYETFYKLYEDGLVYRGKRIINQCPYCKTALADIDTEHRELPGIFAYIVYPFVDKSDEQLAEKEWSDKTFAHDGEQVATPLSTKGICVATTRPETMLGDTAIAVNPNDPRYKTFIGHKVILPIMNKEIEVIADDDIDIFTGTGALKVTPAHAVADFEIGQRHNLDIVNVINSEGKMESPAPERFVGMGTVDCSKVLCKELEGAGLLLKIERIKHEVSTCERCHTPIEPIISHQWFVNAKPLAEKALSCLKSGEVKVIPRGAHIALEKFFENIQPWCISRQLWWGQRIPVWYSGGKELHDWLNDNEGKTYLDYEKSTGKKANGTGKIFTQADKPENDPDWKGESLEFEQEEDIFDTWFSSGQWPFSTLGGPGSSDFQRYYPTDVMVHARDILFWWSARMLMLGLYRTGKMPFSTICLTGLILAADGQKMSKSKGNGVKPAEILDKFGADALRLWYYVDSLPGANSPLREDKIKGHRNFVNKIWNASRFILMNIEDSEIDAINAKVKDIELPKEIQAAGSFEDVFYTATKENIKKIETYIEKFRFNLAAEGIREFFWHEICDVWIEEVKKLIENESIGSSRRIEILSKLMFVLKEYLGVMHPFVPYVTEAVWQELCKLNLAEGLLLGKVCEQNVTK